jgi:hypothetical protein
MIATPDNRKTPHDRNGFRAKWKQPCYTHNMDYSESPNQLTKQRFHFGWRPQWDLPTVTNCRFALDFSTENNSTAQHNLRVPRLNAICRYKATWPREKLQAWRPPLFRVLVVPLISVISVSWVVTCTSHTKEDMICLTIITSVSHIPQALIPNSGTVTYIKICHYQFPQQLSFPTRYSLSTMQPMSPGLLQQHAKETSCTSNLGTRCRWMVSLILRLLYSIERATGAHWIQITRAK